AISRARGDRDAVVAEIAREKLENGRMVVRDDARNRHAATASNERTKASTTPGSNARPEPSTTAALASSAESRGRYGRSLESASKTSATATMRPASGISSPWRPRG